ncbi:MAG: hypothetical protein A2Y12_06475 [Planctomycetes bacterium GWF2_42_9]|nr:MAG: hypothetical protein A2Y12_06475 [Planctomycetes bacterium GWF2_42_9]HAL45304.1 hypothetical protein [Phycisphaerales bacterium]
MNKPVLKYLKKLFKTVVFLLCAGYIIKYFYQNWDSLQITFKIDKFSIFCIILFSFTTLLTYTYRFKIIIQKCSGINPPFWQWFNIVMLARFYNLFFAPSGNIYRGIEFKRKFGISYTDYISAGISFTWMDLTLDLILAFIVIMFVNPGFKLIGLEAWQVVGVITTGIIFMPFAAYFALKAISVKSPSLVWTKTKISQVVSATLNNARDLKYLTKIIVWGLLVTIQTLIVYYLIFISFNFKLHLPALMLFYSLLKISTAFIIIPGNVGIQEIAFGILSKEMGTGMAEGILISTVMRVLGTSLIIIIALIIGGKGLFSKEKLKELSNEPQQ